MLCSASRAVFFHRSDGYSPDPSLPAVVRAASLTFSHTSVYSTFSTNDCSTPPRACVARSSDDGILREQSVSPVMDGVVRIECDAHQIFRIVKDLSYKLQILYANRIDVMDVDLAKYRSTIYGHVASVVSRDHVITNRSPFCRVIESLVQISIESECGAAHFSVQAKILKASLEGWNPYQFGIAPTLRHRLHDLRISEGH